MLLVAVAAMADETGGTVACAAEDEACVTSGGLPGLCDADLVCVTDTCTEAGEDCTTEGEWGKCASDEGPCDTKGCATSPGVSSWAVLGLAALATRRRIP